MTLSELSYKTSIRKKYLKKIENGAAPGVLLSAHLLKIARALNLTLYEMFNFD